MSLPILVLLLATSGPASAGPAPSPDPAVSSAAARGIAASTQTVSSIYTGDRSRDPFLPAAMGGTSRQRPAEDAKAEGPEVVDVHAMTLRGIMKDAKQDYALFTSESGASYLLRGGKLYNERNKPVPQITGVIKLKQKTVELIAPGGDVQPYRLGEDEKDKEKR